MSLKSVIQMSLKLLLIIGFIGFNKSFVYSQEKWRFAVVGDTHVGSSDTISEMIPFMLADDIDLVLLPGDIVEGGLACSGADLELELKHWLTIFEPLYSAGVGVYPLRGNHEDDARNNQTVWNRVFSGNYLLPQNGPSNEENLTYSFIHKNALFIGLDDYANIHTVNQQWLNEQLAANTNPHVFVFGHEAAFKVFHTDCLDDSVDARNTFWQSLANAGVKVYFCGHDHFLDVALVDDGDGNNENNIYQYLVGTGGGWLMPNYNYNGDNSSYTLNRQFHENEFGYSLIEVSGDGPNDRTVTITWKKRVWNESTGKNEYVATNNVIQYTVSTSTTVQTQYQDKVKIRPNPARDLIECAGFFGNTSIFNIAGYPVWNGNINGNYTINISNLPSGLYIISDKYASGKFIKLN